MKWYKSWGKEGSISHPEKGAMEEMQRFQVRLLTEAECIEKFTFYQRKASFFNPPTELDRFNPVLTLYTRNTKSKTNELVFS